ILPGEPHPPDTHPSTVLSGAPRSLAPCAGSRGALAVPGVTTVPLVPAARPARDTLDAEGPHTGPPRPVRPVVQPAQSERDTSPCAAIAAEDACRYRRSRGAPYRSSVRYTPSDTAHS